jgi:Protein of unknown function (DUF2752)
VPPPLNENPDYEVVEDEPIDVWPGDPPQRLNVWVRGTLLFVAAFLIAGFSLAIYLDPYKEDGSARRMETHRQLGLPECTFKERTGMPCPSCGMTSSFSLYVRGDLWNSMKANWVGTILATVCLLLIPWGIGSAVLGRPLFLRSLELPISIGIIALLSLLLLRWGIVLSIQYLTGTPPTP